MAKEVILTGLRSNAEYHLGNYLGAILPMIELQKKHAGKYQLNMFIPDLHSFTTPIDHDSLYEQSLKNLKVFVAAGLDINQPDTFIYRQSFIPPHSELTWIFDCFIYMGELSRMTQFKDKSTKEKEYITSDIAQQSQAILTSKYANVGLFNYPVLMAADILLYGAKWVPVGEDQRQHIELTRDIAQRFNKKFGDLFVVPEDWQKQVEFVGLDKGVRIRSLRNPQKKMSKSVDDPAGTIMLSDPPDEAAEKIISATTDSFGKVKFDWDNQPGVSNILQIQALISEQSQEAVNKKWEGMNSYDELKKATATAVKDFLSAFQSKLAAISADDLKKKLEQDEKAMNEMANAKLIAVQRAVGLRPSS